MANTLYTPDWIAADTLRAFKQKLGFAGSVSNDYDREFAGRAGFKVGDTVRLRDAVRFTVSDGDEAVVQPVLETTRNLALNRHKHIAINFSARDMTLSVERFRKRYTEAAAIALANYVDADGLLTAYQSCPNYVGTPGTVPTSTTAFLVYAQAKGIIDKFAAPDDDNRVGLITSDMEVNFLDATKGLFNSQADISKDHWKRGRISRHLLSADFSVDNNCRTHTVGVLGGVPLVDGAGQTGTSILTKGWTGSVTVLKKGDIITFASTHGVNPVSFDSQAALRQHVVTADVISTGGGAATIPVYPGITTSGSTQTTDISPADNAVILIFGHASSYASVATPQGMFYHPDAYTFAMAPFEPLQGGVESKAMTDPETGASILFSSQGDLRGFNTLFRWDILYGFAATHPDWACRIAS